MGLIKTAIIAGGGIYAVNKIAKTAIERRQNSNNHSNSQSYPRDNPYPPQGYYGPPPPPLQGPSQHRAAWDETYGGPQDYQGDRDQRDCNPKRQYHPRREYYPRDGITGANSGGYSFPADGDYDARHLQASDYPYQPAYIPQPDNPPSYSPHPQYVQSRSYTQQQVQRYEGPQRQQSPGSLRDMATEMAVDFVGDGKGKSGKRGKKDKGSTCSGLLSEFFR